MIASPGGLAIGGYGRYIHFCEFTLTQTNGIILNVIYIETIVRHT